MSKKAGYNPRGGLTTLLTAPISKSSAQQRAGRAGRTQPGLCFRLYTEDTYNNVFAQTTPPEILDSEISSEILILKAAGHNAVATFDFIDRPHPEIYFRGLRELSDL